MYSTCEFQNSTSSSFDAEDYVCLRGTSRIRQQSPRPLNSHGRGLMDCIVALCAAGAGYRRSINNVIFRFRCAIGSCTKHMLKRLLLITTLLFVLSTLPAWAAPVYVSAGTQIFSINGGAATPLTDLGTGHHPQDLVVGPDGNLYVADFDDSGNSRIYRVV